VDTLCLLPYGDNKNVIHVLLKVKNEIIVMRNVYIL